MYVCLCVCACTCVFVCLFNIYFNLTPIENNISKGKSAQAEGHI